MTNGEVGIAIAQRLSAANLATLVWPNRDTAPAVPYIIFDHVPVGAEDRTLAGGALALSGYVMMTVATALNGYATPGETLAASVVALFPYGLRLNLADGKVLIRKPPEVLRGFPDAVVWRTPVKVTYLAS